MNTAVNVPRYSRMSVLVASLVLCTLLWGCEGYDPFSYELDSKGWHVEKSEHFIYHYFPSDTCFTSPEQASSEVLACLEELEDFLDWFSDFFKVDFSSKKIYYYKHPTIDDVGEAYGKGWSDNWRGYAVIYGRNEIHALREIERHEVVHIISWQINFPPAVLNEGIAERYESGNISSDVLHLRVVDVIRTGEFIPLNSVITWRRFKEIDRGERCGTFRVEIASWTAYLIDFYGIDRFRDLFERTDGCCWNENNILNTIREVYGKTFSDMESEWVAFITGEYLQLGYETIACRTECENH